MIGLVLALQLASYSAQRSSGYPLIVNGQVNAATVAQLAKFDVSTWEATPWGKDVDGAPRTDAIMLLRQLNPRAKVCLYLLVGDQWLPPTFTPGAWDHSAFADIFRAFKGTNAWLRGTDGGLWMDNFRIDLANRAVTDMLASVYCSLIATRLFDMVFLDDCHTSIAWTNNGQRTLDTRPFRTPAAMDSSRAANVARLIARLHVAGGCGFLVARNGTGPAAGEDVSMREGLGSLISVDEAMRWMETPGVHWLKAECYSPSECAYKASLLRGIASHGDAIISLGPNRDNPPVLP